MDGAGAIESEIPELEERLRRSRAELKFILDAPARFSSYDPGDGEYISEMLDAVWPHCAAKKDP